MKIVYIYDAIYPYVKGGAEKRFWELAKRLAKKGHEVHLFGMKWWQGEDLLIKEGVYIHGICKPMDLYLKDGRRSIKQSLYFSYKILFALHNEKFDLIDCNAFTYLPFFSIKFISKFKKIALVTTWQEVWDRYWYKYLGYVKGFMARFIERRVIKLSRNIIVHSIKIKERLVKCGAKGKMELITDGIDLAVIDNELPSLEKTDLIFAGRLIRDKNVDILLKTVFLLKKEFNRIRCIVIGQGPEKENLISLAERLNLGENIVFRDFLEYSELIGYIKASKIFVFPSTREGFGIVVVEAMACGLPVIAIDHPLNAATDLINEGQNGFICQLDENDIARKTVELLKDESLRGNLAKTAVSFAKDYDWDKIAGQNEEFYNEVLNKAIPVK